MAVVPGTTPFLDAVRERPVVFDGAIGTQLYERGIYINRSFEDANLSRADLVQSIHRAYLEAGAEVLTTNTFSANRVKLGRHGLDGRVTDINLAGARIAREVAEGHAWVAGSVGPTGRNPNMLLDGERAELKEAFREQIAALAEGGVDLICMETFRQLSELRLAMEAAREVCDLPIIAHMAFDAEHKTGDGATPERVVMLLKDWGADVVGANCMEGPHVVFEVVKSMVGHGVPIIAQPNAGYPKRVDERFIYMATPEYYGVYARRFFKAGVAIVGGCCGTGPEHITRVSAAARMMGGGRVQVQPHAEDPHSVELLEELSTPVHERSALAEKIMRVWHERVNAPADAKAPLSRDNFVVSVEVNPPQGLDPSKALRAARKLIKGGVDVINIADGPRASVRMSNWALAQLIDQEIGCETILHVCGRDRNLLGVQSDLLAYHVLGQNNLVVITGDPPKVGDYPHATAVFDLDSIGILRLTQSLNHGIDPAGKSVGHSTHFFCACGAEPAAQDYERELRRLEMKKAAGARFIMTQPVYDPAVLDRFLDDIAHLDMPVMVGLLPLASWRNAEFLHNEVPGMAVPNEIRARMYAASERQAAGVKHAAREEGIRIAREALQHVQDRVVGAYIMPPFGRYTAALEILSYLDGYEVPAKKGSNRSSS